MKKTVAGLRQKIFWSKRNWWRASVRPEPAHVAVELQVDVLEARAAHLEAGQVEIPRERPPGERVEAAHRVAPCRARPRR